MLLTNAYLKFMFYGGGDMHGGQVIAHIDVNSAYVSWSAAEHLYRGGEVDFREIPSIVGGDPKTRHGIVLAKSIPAKKYGIKTAELVWQAVQKCPHLHIIKPDANLYTRCSQAMIELVREYSDRVFVYSIDEVFIDLSGMQLLFGDPVQLCHHIRHRIRRELGFTVSIGVSSNMLLAKMASDLVKPDATTTLWPEEVEEKMWPLPVGDLFMCGLASTTKLTGLGIKTIGQLAKMDVSILRRHLHSHGELLWNSANGRGEGIATSFKPLLQQKGVGNSSTISYDVTDRREAELHILSLCESVGLRLRNSQLAGKVITISLRDTGFVGVSHQRRINRAINTTTHIHEVAMELFDEVWDRRPIRNIGVRVSDCETADAYQMSLFDMDNKRQMLDSTIDRIRTRYGNAAITRAAFLHSGIRPITGVSLHDDQMVLPVFSNGLNDPMSDPRK